MKLQALMPALITAAFLSTTFGSVSHAEVVSTGTETPLQAGIRVCQKHATEEYGAQCGVVCQTKVTKLCNALNSQQLKLELAMDKEDAAQWCATNNPTPKSQVEHGEEEGEGDESQDDDQDIMC